MDKEKRKEFNNAVKKLKHYFETYDYNGDFAQESIMDESPDKRLVIIEFLFLKYKS